MTLEESIVHDADRCVLCGMCLPHCPTYLLSGNEAESPRGRISLMLALARGQLEPTPALASHLESCLACRACEAMCPSEVRYGRLLGNTRRLLASHRLPPLRARLITALTSRAWVQRLALATARVAPAVLLEKLPLRPLSKQKQHPFPVPPPPSRGAVTLFVGCTGRGFDAPAFAAATTLLRYAGFDVVVPEGQTCCGALHHSQGDQEGFERRARANVKALAGAEKILFIASGCGAMLKEYGEWLGDEGAEFGSRVEEITGFLAREGFPEGIHFTPLEGVVAVHVPCTQRHVLHTPDAAQALLKFLPELKTIALPENSRCCGAAGTHVLTHPDTAAALRAPKIAALGRDDVRYLVTTNIGCALHLAAGAGDAGLNVEVLHPVALLARHLRGADQAATLAARKITH